MFLAALPSLPSVSLSYAGALRAYLRERGLPGPARREAAVPTARIAGDAYGAALLEGGRSLGDTALGLGFGTRVGGAGFGLLGVAAATAGSLREAIVHLQRFESLTSTLGHVDVRRSRGTVTLAWRPWTPVAAPVAEGIVAGWVSFGRYLVGEHVEVRGVSFAHRCASSVSRYEAALDCPVRFGTGEHAVTIAADLLDARPRFADARINGALDAWLDRCTTPLAAPADRPASRQVAALLGERLPLPEADERAAARLLGVSPRTLQRRLADEGTGFRHLLDAARAQHAVQALLGGGPSLADLSADVGFGEQSSLCRAFRRWTGHAPLALRERLAPLFRELRP